MTDRDVWLRRVGAMRRHIKGNARAPHKPLLMLYALGRLSQGIEDPLRYVDVEPDLLSLLQDWGPPHKTTPSYPFRRLANDDGLWVIHGTDGELLGDERKDLVRADAVGRLDPVFVEALRVDPGLLVLVARLLLDENWPPTLHDGIASDVGLDFEGLEIRLVRERIVHVRRRDPAFRRRVLVAYEYRCAVCGYDGRLDNAAVGLDAAHIRWHSADGPDVVANALCLCSFHHVLLDKGVLGITPEHTLRVSKFFIGHSDASRHLVLRHQGEPLIEPQPGEALLAEGHIAWHDREVFRTPGRGVASASA